MHGRILNTRAVEYPSYAPKQALKQWRDMFEKMLFSNGFFFINDPNKCLYCKSIDNSSINICLYVDDMLFMGTDFVIVTKSKSFLASNFDMKDIGRADVILGIKITRDSNGIFLSQEHSVEKILKKFGYYDCKPLSSSYDANIQLKKNKGERVSLCEYAQIIGSVMYLMNCT